MPQWLQVVRWLMGHYMSRLVNPPVLSSATLGNGLLMVIQQSSAMGGSCSVIATVCKRLLW